jgi:hypothetical protein
VKRYILLGVVLVVLLFGGYVAAFKRGMVARMAKGYKSADTPQVAADMFKKAIEEREYEYAADYCTGDYAEQLKRGGAAAKEYAVALDNLIYQMKERDLIRDQTKLVFYKLDPFPKDIAITVGKESGDSAVATITFTPPDARASSSTQWKLDDGIQQVFVRSFKYTGYSTQVEMVKVDGKWKFDFRPDNTIQQKVSRMNDKYKQYVNPFEMVGQEVKNDPSTREDTTERLKKLIEGAAKE